MYRLHVDIDAYDLRHGTAALQTRPLDLVPDGPPVPACTESRVARQQDVRAPAGRARVCEGHAAPVLMQRLGAGVGRVPRHGGICEVGHDVQMVRPGIRPRYGPEVPRARKEEARVWLHPVLHPVEQKLGGRKHEGLDCVNVRVMICVLLIL